MSALDQMLRRVVVQKRAPPLTSRPASLNHVFDDARLGDRKPKLEQFTMNTRRYTPEKSFLQAPI